MTDTTTTALRKAGAVTDDQINQAVEAVIGGDQRADHPIADGYTLDVPKALDAKDTYREALASDRAGYVRTMVRTAILLTKLDPV